MQARLLKEGKEVGMSGPREAALEYIKCAAEFPTPFEVVYQVSPTRAASSCKRNPPVRHFGGGLLRLVTVSAVSGDHGGAFCVRCC